MFFFGGGVQKIKPFLPRLPFLSRAVRCTMTKQKEILTLSVEQVCPSDWEEKKTAGSPTWIELEKWARRWREVWTEHFRLWSDFPKHVVQ